MYELKINWKPAKRNGYLMTMWDKSEAERNSWGRGRNTEP
jgi:hypothetical protein